MEDGTTTESRLVTNNLVEDEAMQLGTSMEVETQAAEAAIDQQQIEIDQSIMETTNNLIEQIEKHDNDDIKENNYAELTAVGQVVDAQQIDPNNTDNVMLLLDSATTIEGQKSGTGLGDDDSTLHEDDLGLNEDNSLKGRLKGL